jgi:branched-chain amino acid transport system ATP-binding protein
VRENLILAYLASASRGGMGEGGDRAEELMAITALTPLADAPAAVLSGGQRMLLQACAGFMIPALRLYVLDEPFAGINPVIKDMLVGLIERENRAGRAFLIVSHEMEIVRRLCPRVTVLIQGGVAAEGTLDEVARRPEVIAAYLGGAAA